MLILQDMNFSLYSVSTVLASVLTRSVQVVRAQVIGPGVFHHSVELLLASRTRIVHEVAVLEIADIVCATVFYQSVPLF